MGMGVNASKSASPTLFIPIPLIYKKIDPKCQFAVRQGEGHGCDNRIFFVEESNLYIAN